MKQITACLLTIGSLLCARPVVASLVSYQWSGTVELYGDSDPWQIGSVARRFTLTFLIDESAPRLEYPGMNAWEYELDLFNLSVEAAVNVKFRRAFAVFYNDTGAFSAPVTSDSVAVGLYLDVPTGLGIVIGAPLPSTTYDLNPLSSNPPIFASTLTINEVRVASISPYLFVTPKDAPFEVTITPEPRANSMIAVMVMAILARRRVKLCCITPCNGLGPGGRRMSTDWGRFQTIGGWR